MYNLNYTIIMRKYLYHIFLIVFLFLFGSIFLYIGATQFNLITLFYMFAFVLLLSGIIYCMEHRKQICNFDARILVGITILFLLPLQIYLGMRLEVNPSWDFGYIYQAASSFATEGTISSVDFSYYRNPGLDSYFKSCPNNIGMFLLLSMYFKLVSIFTRPTILSGIILNIIMIDVTFVLFVVFIRKAFSNKAAILSIFV